MWQDLTIAIHSSMMFRNIRDYILNQVTTGCDTLLNRNKGCNEAVPLEYISLEHYVPHGHSSRDIDT